ncbi:hypothetical protein QVD17_23962 [Tagetes erecta]|uniref:Wax synthase domain-containing protein n=1 Tax=Tagetes erecta TaxID=13708 RepID=A0AAD8KEZ5_TARER|nr:hypothetical protein QVD17_23962 [Tagetes erecta]
MDLKLEIKNLVKVAIFASISLSYCYFVAKIIPKGCARLLIILPILFLSLLVPIFFESVHLIGPLSFFISWLASFKLALFAFGKGPLSTPLIPLTHFISLACFPIGIGKTGLQPRKFLGVKVVLLAIFLRVYYDYGNRMNPMIAWIFLAFSVYFCLELILAISSKIIGFLLGVELEPHFNEPYLSTSLQDFWGRRWNLMVNRILHTTIYSPVYTLLTHVIGRVWAQILAILATFVVSGLMHELIFFYLSRDRPTWDTMAFFCLHGVCLIIEIVTKKYVKLKWSILSYMNTPFVVLFMLLTSYWLFYPDMVRCKIFERAFEEYKIVFNLVGLC